MRILTTAAVTALMLAGPGAALAQAPLKPTPVAAAAEAPKPDFAERKQLAGRYLEALGIVQTMRVMMTSMMSSENFAPDSRLSAEEKAQVNQIVIEALDRVMPQYIDKFTDVYAETYTVEELRALVDFYSSPMGQSLVIKQRQVAARGQELIDWFTPVLLGEVTRILHERQGDAAAPRTRS